jgi:uncharacterized protein
VKAVALALSSLLTASACSAPAEKPVRTEEEPIHAIAELPPRPSGPVLDLADILPTNEEAKLDQQLRDLNARTGDALVVVTIRSLGGETIEDYSYNLFNTWGIGDADTRRGLLLLVAPTERKVRIEVGCGLESTISDITAGRIIRDRITPEYRQGDLVGGTLAGVEAMLARLNLPKPANDPGPHSPGCNDRPRKAA